MRLVALVLALLGLAAPADAEVVGTSVQGREIRATRIGDADAPVTVLAVGSIHGNETAGHAVVKALRERSAPAGVQVWLVTTANPDGVALGTRQNARGVDLNRNFPRRWRGGGSPGDPYFPGTSAGSEPETKAMRRFIRRIDPDVTVWFHQALELVNLASGADPEVVRAYGRRVDLPARRLPRYRGTASSWQNHRDPRSSAFVAELAAGSLSASQVRRHADAVLAAGGDAAAAAARRYRRRP